MSDTAADAAVIAGAQTQTPCRDRRVANGKLGRTGREVVEEESGRMYDDAGLRSVVARVVALSFVVLGLLCTGGLPVVASAATPGGTYKLQALFGNGQGIASGASDVAVSPATGNIFIAEFNNGAVGVCSPDASAGGNLLTHPDVYSPSGRSAQDLAADPSSDALYVADSAFGVGVSRFLS